MDANAAPPAPSQPFGGLLETVREERQQDRKIKLIESLSRTAIFRLEMQMSMPAEQRTDMAAHNNLSLEEFDRRLEQTLALARARAGSMNYGDLRDGSLAYMQSRAAEILPSRAWEEEDRAYIAETEREMVAAAAAAVEACAADTAGQTCYICLDGATEEGLVRGCSCRGSSGFAHISCLARQANIQLGQHLHCMRDIQDCRDNGFAVLQKLDDGTYDIAYRLDEAGNQAVLDYMDSTPDANGQGHRNGETIVNGAHREARRQAPRLHRALARRRCGADGKFCRQRPHETSGVEVVDSCG